MRLDEAAPLGLRALQVHPRWHPCVVVTGLSCRWRLLRRGNAEAAAAAGAGSRGGTERDPSEGPTATGVAAQSRRACRAVTHRALDLVSTWVRPRAAVLLCCCVCCWDAGLLCVLLGCWSTCIAACRAIPDEQIALNVYSRTLVGEGKAKKVETALADVRQGESTVQLRLGEWLELAGLPADVLNRPVARPVSRAAHQRQERRVRCHSVVCTGERASRGAERWPALGSRGLDVTDVASKSCPTPPRHRFNNKTKHGMDMLYEGETAARNNPPYGPLVSVSPFAVPCGL